MGTIRDTLNYPPPPDKTLPLALPGTKDLSLIGSIWLVGCQLRGCLSKYITPSSFPLCTQALFKVGSFICMPAFSSTTAKTLVCVRVRGCACVVARNFLLPLVDCIMPRFSTAERGWNGAPSPPQSPQRSSLLVGAPSLSFPRGAKFQEAVEFLCLCNPSRSQRFRSFTPH